MGWGTAVRGVFSGVVVGGGLVNEVEGALAQEPEDLGSSPALLLCASVRPTHL